MKIIFLFTLRRSGNHYLITELLKNVKNFVAINDVLNFTFENFIKYSKIEITERIVSNKWTGFKDADVVLISFEDRELLYDPKKEYNKNNIIYNNNEFGELDKFKKNNIDFKSIIFIRSAYDNIASLFNFYINNGNQINKAKESSINHIRLWEMYANHFCNNKIDSIKIYYNKFVKSKQ